MAVCADALFWSTVVRLGLLDCSAKYYRRNAMLNACYHRRSPPPPPPLKYVVCDCLGNYMPQTELKFTTTATNMLTESDVTSYFRSDANRDNIWIFGLLQIAYRNHVTRLKLKFDKLTDPQVAHLFEAVTAGNFADLCLVEENIDNYTENIHGVLIDSTSEIIQNYPEYCKDR